MRLNVTFEEVDQAMTNVESIRRPGRPTSRSDGSSVIVGTSNLVRVQAIAA